MLRALASRCASMSAKRRLNPSFSKSAWRCTFRSSSYGGNNTALSLPLRILKQLNARLPWLIKQRAALVYIHELQLW
jgi:hypothetical protein